MERETWVRERKRKKKKKKKKKRRRRKKKKRNSVRVLLFLLSFNASPTGVLREATEDEEEEKGRKDEK